MMLRASLMGGGVVALLTACAGLGAPPPTPTLDALTTAGLQVFKARCATCHALQLGTVIIGPSLVGIATYAETRVPGYSARDYIELSILRPSEYVVEGFDDQMPKNFGAELTSEDLEAVTAFLLTLK